MVKWWSVPVDYHNKMLIHHGSHDSSDDESQLIMALIVVSSAVASGLANHGEVPAEVTRAAAGWLYPGFLTVFSVVKKSTISSKDSTHIKLGDSTHIKELLATVSDHGRDHS